MEQLFIKFVKNPNNMVGVECNADTETMILTVAACVQAHEEVGKIIFSAVATICQQHPEVYEQFKKTVETGKVIQAKNPNLN